MIENNDLGLIPEPILEDKGQQYGSKYAIMRQRENRDLLKDILVAVDACESGDEGRIKSCLGSPEPSVRYWAARAAGSKKLFALRAHLEAMLKDRNGTVRVAAAQSLVQLGDLAAVRILVQEIENGNLLVGMYAIRAIEAIGPQVKAETKVAIRNATKSDYEFTRRIANRLVKTWNL